MGQDATEIRREIEATRERMGDTVEAIGYKADVPSRVRDNVNGRIDSVKGTINDAVNGARNAVLGTTQSATDSVNDLQDGISDRAQALSRKTSAAVQNPLGIALGALAVGMLAGLLVPVTDIEREKLAPIGNDVASRAQTAVAEAVEAGKTVLAEAAGSVAQSAQDKGRTIAEHAVAGTPFAATDAGPGNVEPA